MSHRLVRQGNTCPDQAAADRASGTGGGRSSVQWGLLDIKVRPSAAPDAPGSHRVTEDGAQTMRAVGYRTDHTLRLSKATWTFGCEEEEAHTPGLPALKDGSMTEAR